MRRFGLPRATLFLVGATGLLLVALVAVVVAQDYTENTCCSACWVGSPTAAPHGGKEDCGDEEDCSGHGSGGACDSSSTQYQSIHNGLCMEEEDSQCEADASTCTFEVKSGTWSCDYPSSGGCSCMFDADDEPETTTADGDDCGGDSC